MLEDNRLKLSKLSLKNFATFDDQEVSFKDHFNAIIGETGSGKSLILDALQLILGGRADKKLIRYSCDFAIVEAIFETSSKEISNYFASIDYPFDNNEITIKRILYPNGKSRSFLNFQSCSLLKLNQFARKFIDIVGQFENQKLLSSDYQLQLVDHYAGTNNLCASYQDIYNELISTKNQISDLNQRALEYNQKKDYIDFQIREFENLNPTVEREQELLELKQQYQDKQQQAENIVYLNQIFGGDESNSGIFQLLGSAKKVISQTGLDQETIDQFISAEELLNNINYKINCVSTIEDIESDMEPILDELDLYQRLKRKYHVDTKGLSDIYQDFLTEKQEVQNFDSILSELKSKEETLTIKAKQIASKLHAIRLEYSTSLADELTQQIRKLKMEGATARLKATQVEQLSKFGSTSIIFEAETNPGEGYYPIKDIASGGELSRILLALRTILSSKDSISIFLFDEIDTGIGGETALAVGNALSTVARDSQVIAITHLPQIANFAEQLIKVTKSIVESHDKERTVSQIQQLHGKQIGHEVSNMAPLH